MTETIDASLAALDTALAGTGLGEGWHWVDARNGGQIEPDWELRNAHNEIAQAWADIYGDSGIEIEEDVRRYIAACSPERIRMLVDHAKLLLRRARAPPRRPGPQRRDVHRLRGALRASEELFS